MERLTRWGHNVDLQVTENEASASYKQVVKVTWKSKYQLISSHFHRHHSAKRAIRTFKACFMVILAGFNPTSPSNMWDKLLSQTELTLNLLRQATPNHRILAWEYFNGPFNFGATPLGPIGSCFIFHNKLGNQKSWNQRGHEGFSLGPSLKHCRCFSLIKKKKTPSFQIPTLLPHTAIDHEGG